MFVKTPSVEELVQLDLTSLVDMLSEQTTAYIQKTKEDGTTTTTLEQKEFVDRIQLAIDRKMSPSNSFNYTSV
jgi:hypothetical protein